MGNLSKKAELPLFEVLIQRHGFGVPRVLVIRERRRILKFAVGLVIAASLLEARATP